MPIYEYRCSSCGNQLEKLQRLSDEPLKDCPACGQAALLKLVSAAGFRLKGAGWYETDFKKDGQKNLHDSGEKTKSGVNGEAAKGESSKSEASKSESSKSEGAKSESSKSATSGGAPGTKKADSKPAAPGGSPA
ncbi:MAG: zinc ribbon domain-containing protein [Xanthomonadales bacterium]|nr:zinc ribbon domain-containing protein [Xanthomonadales bacterium]